MKLHLLLFLFLAGNISFCLPQLKEDFLPKLLIEELDAFYELEDYRAYYMDRSRSLSFNEVKKKKFKLGEFPINYQSSYWFKFRLKPGKKAEFLMLFSGISDLLTVYVPRKNTDSYEILNLGQIREQSIQIDVAESSMAEINNYETIDFLKPFYLKKEIKTDWGELNLEFPMVVFLTDNENYLENYLNKYTLTFKFQFYTLIIFFSFILFFVNFLISRDRNYLNYSLYLLCTTLIFAVRLPNIYNEIIKINPELFQYLRVFSIITASWFYFYFVVSFLNFKNNYPKIYKLSVITLISIVVFVFMFLLLIIAFPYIPHKFMVMLIFKIVFTSISLIVFVLLLFQKRTTIIYKAVLISSLLLILGHLISTLTDFSFYFLNTVVIEIIIFTAIVSYNNKLNSKKRLENEFLFKQEQINNLNLKELDRAKSNFFTNISHEFRTPLTLITSPIEEALEDDSLSNKKREQFIMAKRNSDRLLALVNQLLDLSKIDAGQLKLRIQKGNIQNIISGLAESFIYSAEQKKISYHLNIEKGNEESWFDRDALEKITVNLLSNAIKYTPKNGSITCKSLIENNTIQLSVKNTGVGFSKNELENIFTRFYQTNEQNEGTGIGLALVKELVELHKGVIKVDSKAKEWICFTVTLPIDKKSFKEEAFVYSTEIKSNYKTQNLEVVVAEDEVFEVNEKPILLIVEDNMDVRTLLKQNFEDDFNILTAQNGQIGIDLAVEHVPDIIISDIMMPVKDGVALTNELKNNELTSHIPVILLTAKAGDKNEIKGLEIGADDYITKPFNSKVLKTKVLNLIDIRRKLQSRYSQEVVLTPKDVAVTNLDEKFLEKIQEVLEKKLVESSFSAGDFSDAVGMSRMQLHRKIKALTGLSTSEFIRSQRLKLAADLLKTSNINISQVGYSVGFNDHSYFAKCFKNVFNCTPTEYARQHQTE